MPARNIGMLAGLVLMLGACGLRIPEIQEFPQDTVDGQMLVHAIMQNVTCEVQDAVVYLYEQDALLVRRNQGFRNTAFLDNWGAQILLILTIGEKTSINPVINWLTPSAKSAPFNLGAGGTLSFDAGRVEKVRAYHTIRELRRLGYCDPRSRSNGPSLLQSDLKLRQWLVYTVMLGGTGQIDYPTRASNPFKQEVISHAVKFEILSTGTLTPGWKLSRLSVNQSGTFLSASRQRTHDLVITLGPIDPATLDPKAKRAPQPAPAPASSAVASEVGISVGNAIRSALEQ
jgi:hypothetical protein